LTPFGLFDSLIGGLCECIRVGFSERTCKKHLRFVVLHKIKMSEESNKVLKANLADCFGIIEDLEHTQNCTSHLLNIQTNFDECIGRALWHSALISLRRSAANAATMGKISGQTYNPIHRNKASSALSKQKLVTYNKYLDLADSLVAHRKPLKDKREVNILNAGSGDVFVSTFSYMPTNQEILDLGDVASDLYEYVSLDADRILRKLNGELA